MGSLTITTAVVLEAVSTLVIALLTAAIVYLTRQIKRQNEALQMPCIIIRTDDQRNEVGQDPTIVTEHVELENVGMGPALDIRYELKETKSGARLHPIRCRGTIHALPAGSRHETDLLSKLLDANVFEFRASYRGLSQINYRTDVPIEGGKVPRWTFQPSRKYRPIK